MTKLVMVIDQSDYECSCQEYYAFEYKSKDDFILDLQILLEENLKERNAVAKIWRDYYNKEPNRCGPHKSVNLQWQEWFSKRPKEIDDSFSFCKCKFKLNLFTLDKGWHDWKLFMPDIYTLDEWFEANIRSE